MYVEDHKSQQSRRDAISTTVLYLAMNFTLPRKWKSKRQIFQSKFQNSKKVSLEFNFSFFRLQAQRHAKPAFYAL